MAIKGSIAICGMACNQVQMEKQKELWEEKGRTIFLPEPFDFVKTLGKDKDSDRKWEEQRSVLDGADTILIYSQKEDLQLELWLVACYAYLVRKPLEIWPPVSEADLDGLAWHYVDLSNIEMPSASSSREERAKAASEVVKAVVAKHGGDARYVKKIQRYNKLVNDVDSVDATKLRAMNMETFHTHYGMHISEVNLWTYWQGGRGHLDADVLMAGQDFAGVGDRPNRLIGYRRETFQHLPDGAKVGTDTNLCELFKVLGFSNLWHDFNNYRPLFFTNFVPWYRVGIPNSSGYQAAWTRESIPFFQELVEIIEPAVILCLGQATFDGVLKSAGEKMPPARTYNDVIAAGPRLVTIGGVKTWAFPLAHPGSMGSSNRNRAAQGDEYGFLDLQKQDWQRVRDKLNEVETRFDFT